MSPFWAWIVKNLYEAESSTSRTFESMSIEAPPPTKTPSLALIDLEELPPPCRILLRMLIADPPPSYEEVSQVLEMPVGSIGPRRARCLARLRTRLAKLESAPDSSSVIAGGRGE